MGSPGSARSTGGLDVVGVFCCFHRRSDIGGNDRGEPPSVLGEVDHLATVRSLVRHLGQVCAGLANRNFAHDNQDTALVAVLDRAGR